MLDFFYIINRKYLIRTEDWQ